MEKKYETKIKELLIKMTLEEKIGQLHQSGPSLVGAFDVSFEELVNMVFDGRLSKEEFQKLMSEAEQDYHEEDLKAGKIGSYNGIGDVNVANKLQRIAIEETRLGIPLLFGYDVIHGYRTITPIPLGESCAWEPKLWEKTAKISAKEATADGIHMTFAPMVDVSKDARWGRISEGAGEDTFLNSEYGVAKVKGFQGADIAEEEALASCVKHFAAYGAAEAGRDYNRVDMSMQRLYEEYLPPFEACIKAGARAVMPAFNDINGVPCTANKWLLQKVLRKDWGFDGMTISDANAIAECVDHGIAETGADAARLAIQAGVNMDMVSNCYNEELKNLVESKQVDEADLDEAVANVLRIKFELGLFERPYQSSEERKKEELLTQEKRAIALEASEKSMVLLKNDGILPLENNLKLGILGSLADNRGEMTGAWAIKAIADDCVSLIDACKMQKLDYIYTTDLEEAGACDLILLAMGESKNESGEAASKANISLPIEQIELLKAAKDTGKPVVVVLFNGRPLVIPEVEENASAILEAWHPGVEAGNGILNILFGKINPSAKLTTTFPSASGQCPIYYDHINTGRPAGKSKFTSKYLDTPIEPLYSFGYGLSYTQYEYKEMRLETKGENATVSVKVKNIGNVDGEEIVQCYFGVPVAKRVRPIKKLVDYTKIPLRAGEDSEVVFHVPLRNLGYYDPEMNYVVDDGKYIFYVGGNSKDCLSESLLIRNHTVKSDTI